MRNLNPLPHKNFSINDSFWASYISLVRGKVIPYQWDALNDNVPGAKRSSCIRNFEIAAGICEGEFFGIVFQDSDLYKWLETVALSLEIFPDPELEKLADDAIALIGKAQRPDGYINTYYTVKKQGKRWINLHHGHELYCAGHLIEAATAYFNATGKRHFLEIACRFADCIDNTFGEEERKLHGYPGHQEIELALYKLYKTTGEWRYLQLANYFISQRGKQPNYFSEELEKENYEDVWTSVKPIDTQYSQSHKPPVEQTEACGHAVRAVYMYSAMADLAAELNDSALLKACDTLYRNITEKQMYITGGIGSTSIGESFTTNYDLPNDLVYAESCASIGLMMFCQRMYLLHKDARYIDTLERCLYNTVIAGISLAGTEFFYVNPLKVDPTLCEHSPHFKHVKPVRQKWFECSCCPPNITRTIMSLGSYAFSTSEDSLFVNLYIGGSVTFQADGRDCRLEMQTNYPYGNEVVLKAIEGEFGLSLRSPADSPILTVSVNGAKQEFVVEKGYVRFEKIKSGDKILVSLDVEPKLVYCNTRVRENIGKAAVMRGPFVYCVEEVDNGSGLEAYFIQQNATFAEDTAPEKLPPETIALRTQAFRYVSSSEQQEELYSGTPPQIQDAQLKLIPYFLWANRGENEMSVYISVQPEHL